LFSPLFRSFDFLIRRFAAVMIISFAIFITRRHYSSPRRAIISLLATLCRYSPDYRYLLHDIFTPCRQPLLSPLLRHAASCFIRFLSLFSPSLRHIVIRHCSNAMRVARHDAAPHYGVSHFRHYFITLAVSGYAGFRH